jgi:hypothetical protein
MQSLADKNENDITELSSRSEYKTGSFFYQRDSSINQF